MGGGCTTLADEASSSTAKTLGAVAALLTAIAGLIAALAAIGVFEQAAPEVCYGPPVVKQCPAIAPYCTDIDSNDNARKKAILEERCRVWAKDNGWQFVEYVSARHPHCRLRLPEPC